MVMAAMLRCGERLLGERHGFLVTVSGEGKGELWLNHKGSLHRVLTDKQKEASVTS